VRVYRMHTIRDEIGEITRFLSYTLDHDKADIVVTTGGLGPTYDDMTYESVAEYFGTEIYENPRALLYLEERVELLNVLDTSRVRTLVPERRKMASIPRGGIPLYNPCGAAPGLWYDRAGQVLICLPGVPGEMSGIWEIEAQPRLKGLTEGIGYDVRHFTASNSDESALAPIIADAVAKFPEVHFKTRPKRVGKSWEMKVDIAQFTSDDNPSRVNEAVEYLRKSLEDAGMLIELRLDL
jgi:nicotinamide-nucleotide amidase